jgi:hypothetical protein
MSRSVSTPAVTADVAWLTTSSVTRLTRGTTRRVARLTRATADCERLRFAAGRRFLDEAFLRDPPRFAADLRARRFPADFRPAPPFRADFRLRADFLLVAIGVCLLGLKSLGDDSKFQAQ